MSGAKRSAALRSAETDDFADGVRLGAGFASSVVRILARGRTSAAEVQRRAMGESMQGLPSAEREALLAERARVLVVLRDRGLVDDELAAIARDAPLGEWWRLDDRER